MSDPTTPLAYMRLHMLDTPDASERANEVVAQYIARTVIRETGWGEA